MRGLPCHTPPLPACSASRAARARPTGTRPDEVATPAKCGQLDPRSWIAWQGDCKQEQWLGFGQGIAGLVLVNKKGSRQKVWNRSEAKKQVKGGRVGCGLLLASLEKMGMQAPGAAMFAAKIVALLLHALRRGPHAMAHSDQSECQNFVLLQSVKSSTSSKSSISSSQRKRFQPPAITHTSGCTHPCASSRAASLQVQRGGGGGSRFSGKRRMWAG